MIKPLEKIFEARNLLVRNNKNPLVQLIMNFMTILTFGSSIKRFNCVCRLAVNVYK